MRDLEEDFAAWVKQSKVDSAMEAVTNIVIGGSITFAVYPIAGWLAGVSISTAANIKLTAIFTLVSIARQYALRRAFNGRSPWQAIRGRFL